MCLYYILLISKGCNSSGSTKLLTERNTFNLVVVFIITPFCCLFFLNLLLDHFLHLYYQFVLYQMIYLILNVEDIFGFSFKIKIFIY